MNAQRILRLRAVWWLLGGCLGALAGATEAADPGLDGSAPTEASRMMTTAAGLRGLTPAQAQEGRPVELIGSLTWVSPGAEGGFLEDGSSAVWIDGKLPAGATAGTRLKIGGRSEPGSFSPSVLLTASEILGAEPTSVARDVVGRELQLGKWEGRRVTFVGTAFSGRNLFGEPEIRVLNDGVPVVLIGLPSPPPKNLPPMPHLVRVTGVSSLAIENRLPIDTELLVDSWASLTLVDLGSAPDLPASVPILSLLAATNPAWLDRPVRIQGVVTWRGSDRYVLQDATGGIWVRATNGLTPSVSRNLTLTGTTRRTLGGLDFIGSEVVSNTLGSLPMPIRLETRQDSHARPNHLCRVTLVGRLVHRHWISQGQEWVLVCSEQQESFHAVLAPDIDLAEMDRLKFDSTIQITGVLQRELEIPGHISEARVLVATAGDIHLVSLPPPSRQYVFWLWVSALAAVLALAILSIWWWQSDRMAGLQHSQLAREIQLQRRFALVAETASDLILTLTHTGQITSINPAGHRLISNSNTHMLGQAYATWIVPIYRDLWLDAVGRAAAGEIVPPFDLVVQRADGSNLEMEMLLRPLDAVELHCIGRDLTERRRAAELAEQAVRWQRLHIEQTPLGVVQFDESANIRGWNPAATRIFGWTAEQIIGQSWELLVLPEHRAQVQTHVWDRALHIPEVVPNVNPNVTSDGRVIECEWINSPLIDGTGRIIGVTSFVSDVTVARRMQHELVYREQQLRAIVDSMAEGIVVLGSERQVLSINRAAEQILGVQRRAIVGSILPTDWDCQLADGSRLSPEEYPIFETVKSGRATDAVVFSFQAGDGVRRWLSVNSRVVARHASGAVEQVISTFTDITATRTAEQQRLRLEDQLRHSEKLRALGTLAGGVAHDFNNLLASILGNAELIQFDLTAEHPAAQHAREIGIVAQRGAELVRRVLSFSRPQPARRISLRLSEVVNDALKIATKALPPGVGLYCEFDSAEPVVMGDPSQLGQVVVNLFTNAAHAMEEAGGTLSVDITAIHLTQDSAAANPPLLAGPAVRLRVRDNGIGMDQSTVDRAFEPFFSTKVPGRGTGLGLAIVHNIIQAHQGRVRIDSVVGLGTTIEVLLPVDPEEMLEALNHA